MRVVLFPQSLPKHNKVTDQWICVVLTLMHQKSPFKLIFHKTIARWLKKRKRRQNAIPTSPTQTKTTLQEHFTKENCTTVVESLPAAVEKSYFPLST